MSDGVPADYLLSLRELRRRIHAMGKEFGGVYVAEIDNPDTAPDPLEDADLLLRLIRETPLLFCILGPPHHGTPIGIARTSYFEIELFQAALLQRPIHVFEFDGFTPDTQLRCVLDALRPSLRPVQWEVVRDDTELVAAMRKVLERSADRPKPAWVDTRTLANLATQLWDKRARNGELSSGETPVRWLNGSFIGGRPPDPSVATMLLVRAQQEKNQERRLGRLWMALRELMAAPYTDDAFAELRPLWSQALLGWWGAASWYGLHGHAFLGPLAAGKTFAEVNQRLRTRLGEENARNYAHPAGSLASSHYSVAKLLLDRRGRRWHYDEALRQVQRGLDEGVDEPSGLHLIRGSIVFRQRKPWQAVEEYRTALRLREQARAHSQKIGEALAELGFAYLFTGRIWRGRRLIRDGVRLLEDSPESGFLLRAQRKLAVANLVTGRWPDALAIRRKVRDAAARTAHFDQGRQV